MFTIKEQNFIKDQLTIYRCSETEADIYIEGIQSGPFTVYEMAERLSQNRITVHGACTQLLKKGLLFESRKGKKRILVTEDPEVLLKLISIKEYELENAKANLGYAINLLNKNRNRNHLKPTFKFYEGSEGFKKMLELTLSSKNDYLGLINVELFAANLKKDYLKNYFIRRAENNIHSKLIWHKIDKFAEFAIKNAKNLKIQIRLLESETEWSSGFISWNNCLSLKSFSQGQITCTIIENQDIVSFYRNTIFPKLWQQAVRVPY